MHLFLLAGAALAGDFRVQREHTAVVTRDGIQLRTSVIRPKTDEPVPTILTRSPYPLGLVLARDCRRFARHGFACVWQDVRGRGRSEGEWTPFLHEAADGADTLAWIREQPWSDDKVGWVGTSYLAGTGWAALSGGADVATIVSRVFGPSLRASAYEDALLRHDVSTAWMITMPSSRWGPLLKTPAFRRALGHRPRLGMDEAAVGHEVPWFRQLVDAERPDDDFWTGAAAPMEGIASTVDRPVFLVSGWSDPFLEAQARAWAELPRRDASLWVIGPWSHLGRAPSDLRLRHRHDEGSMLQDERALAWFDAHLRGGEPAPTGVISYVVGGDRWEHRADWPPPTVERPWSLEPAGRCDGRLVEGERPPPEPLTWTYDPADPLPSRGGAGSLSGPMPLIRGTKPGFVRVPRWCERRTDVRQLVSAPLDAPLHVAGTVRMDLRVASTAEDTAFGFRLLLRPPRGRDVMVREGFATLALREGAAGPYVPGAPVTVSPDAQPVELEVPAGWSLVLVLTSSSFPAVEAHPNVGGRIARAPSSRPAEQTVLDATLWLPVVGG